jgi:hypothetical protein
MRSPTAPPARKQANNAPANDSCQADRPKQRVCKRCKKNPVEPTRRKVKDLCIDCSAERARKAFLRRLGITWPEYMRRKRREYLTCNPKRYRTRQAANAKEYRRRREKERRKKLRFCRNSGSSGGQN